MKFRTGEPIVITDSTLGLNHSTHIIKERWVAEPITRPEHLHTICGERINSNIELRYGQVHNERGVFWLITGTHMALEVAVSCLKCQQIYRDK